MSLDPRQLGSRIQKLRKSLKNFSKNPTVEEVHDLRTRTRRVESILQALDLGSGGNERRILAGLKTLRKRAGKVRDMDVLTSDVIGLGQAAAVPLSASTGANFACPQKAQAGQYAWSGAGCSL